MLRETTAGYFAARHQEMIRFASDLVRAPAASSPGVTRAVAATLAQRLTAWGIPHQVVEGNPDQPNVLATVEGLGPGPHLVYNVPLDTPAISDAAKWNSDPFGGAVAEGRLHGRAVGGRACLTLLAYTLNFLASCRDQWPGKVTFTAVSQEGNFGPWGARYLLTQHPEVLGDAAIIGMGTGPETIRFGEKGVIWADVQVRGKASHAAAPHTGVDAVKIGARLISGLDELETIRGHATPDLANWLAATRDLADRLGGAGTTDLMLAVTTCASPVRGGFSHNKVPDRFDMTLDIRVPPGLTAREVLPRLEELVARYPQASMEVTSLNDPSHSNPDGRLFQCLSEAVGAVFGQRPAPTFSLSGSDARLWRYAGRPAAIFGIRSYSSGGADDYILTEDLLPFANAYALASLSYLGAKM